MEAGRRIGKYVLDGRIAVGGMAEVWAAHAEGREGFVKPVALKFILESFSGDPELERLFVNEARIAAGLQHANLVTVFDFDRVGPDEGPGLAGRYYIAMERVEGRDLRHILEAAQRTRYVFPVGLALYIAGEVLKALRYVHERRDARGPLGLVHRDVSPHNVLVGVAGEVKLSDFGIAKAREHSARNTKPGSLRGKIAYASPEQLAGGAIDHRTDQFAAGVTIWELLAGRKLFDGASDLEIIGKVARCEVPPLGERGGRRDVPAAVEAVLRRMLSAEPGARFATTAEALSAVLGLASYSPDGAPLGELVRALLPSSGGLSRTVPLPLVEGARADAPTRTMGDAPPVAAASTTTDVRSGRGAVRIAAALVLGGAVAAAVLARNELGRALSSSHAPPIAASPSPSPSPAPQPIRPAAAEAPTPVAAALAAPAPVAPAPARPLPEAVPSQAASPTRTASARVRSAERHRATARPAPARVSAHAAAVPAPAPAAAARAAEAPPAKSSANGAPIIE